MANTLFLRLEGPLQSWGERGRWSIRDTALEPTKSGLVGLLGCALGWSEDEALRSLSHNILLGIRCDRPGIQLVDYHTVVGGVMSAEGKIKKNASTKQAETVVSERSYLCDASFLAAVQCSAEWVERLSTALQAPVWPFYLGRKSCPPSRPVFEGSGDFASLEEALNQHLPLEARKSGDFDLRMVLESLPGQGKMRSDELISNSRRTFHTRYTRELLQRFSSEAQEV